MPKAIYDVTHCHAEDGEPVVHMTMSIDLAADIAIWLENYSDLEIQRLAASEYATVASATTIMQILAHVAGQFRGIANAGLPEWFAWSESEGHDDENCPDCAAAFPPDVDPTQTD